MSRQLFSSLFPLSFYVCTTVCGREGRGYTYKVSNNDYVCELQDADYDEEGEENVEELCSLRCLGHVFIPYSLCDCRGARVVCRTWLAGARGCCLCGCGWRVYGAGCALLWRHSLYSMLLFYKREGKGETQRAYRVQLGVYGLR